MDRSLFLKRREDNKRKFGELVVELDQHPEVVGYKKKKGIEQYSVRVMGECHFGEVMSLMCSNFCLTATQGHNIMLKIGIEESVPRFAVMIAHGVQTGLSRVICDALGRVVGAAIQYDICDAPPFFNEEERKIMLAESRYFNPRGLSVEELMKSSPLFVFACSGWSLGQKRRRFLNYWAVNQCEDCKWIYGDFCQDGELICKRVYGEVIYRDCIAFSPQARGKGLMSLLLDLEKYLGYKAQLTISASARTISTQGRRKEEGLEKGEVISMNKAVFPDGKTLEEVVLGGEGKAEREERGGWGEGYLEGWIKKFGLYVGVGGYEGEGWEKRKEGEGGGQYVGLEEIGGRKVREGWGRGGGARL